MRHSEHARHELSTAECKAIWETLTELQRRITLTLLPLSLQGDGINLRSPEEQAFFLSTLRLPLAVVHDDLLHLQITGALMQAHEKTSVSTAFRNFILSEIQNL